MGFRRGDTLVVAAGGKGFAVMSLSTNDGNLICDDLPDAEVKGYTTLTR